MIIPNDILFASIASLIVILNGTLLMFPKGSRPAEILIKIFCGVAIFFWVMAIFGKHSTGAYVTASIFGLFAFLIGPFKDNTPEISPNQVNMSPPTIQIGTEFDFPYVGSTGKIYCPSGEKGSYLGILDENNESIIVYSDIEFKNEENFIITGVKNGKILIDKIEK